MKIAMVMLATADGKTTRGDETDIYLWTSKEDQRYFFSLIKKSNLIVMGRSTYEAAKPVMKLETKKLRIVLTRYPEHYLSQTVPGRLEFSSETPKHLVNRLSILGYKKILLVGGSKINGLFLKASLVDEFFLTIEPRIFGSGKNIVDQPELNKQLQLISIKKLNRIGTIILRYKIIRQFSSAAGPKHR